MDWLSQNWVWVLLAAGAIWMFARGRHGGMGMMGGGCCGGHGGHGDHAGHEDHGEHKALAMEALPPSSPTGDATQQPAAQTASGQHQRQHRGHGCC